MRIRRKLLLITVVSIVGLLLVAGAIVFFSLNSIVRSAVERGASQSLKVPTTLDGAAVSPFGGSAALSDLRIGSPEGFAAPHMFTLGSVEVDSSLGNLFGAPVRVASVEIDSPHLVIEQANGKFNFLVLKENLTSDKPAPPDAPTDPEAEPMKLVIDSLAVNNARVSLRPGIPGLKEQYDLTLPAIALSNIGNADGTQTGEEIGRVVSDLVSTMAAKAAESEQLPEEVRQVLQLDVKKLVADVRAEVEDRARATTRDVGEKLEKEVNKTFDKLLDRKKKE